jgi:hypothetical protein
MARKLLEAEALSWDHCVSLADRLVAGDAKECTSMGHSPKQALAYGLLCGQAYAAVRASTGTPVGAFGYTPEGTIWSLWTKLSRGEACQVLREGPAWIHALTQTSRLHRLYNFVDVENPMAIEWLRATGCFDFGASPVERNGAQYLYFRTKEHAHV